MTLSYQLSAFETMIVRSDGTWIPSDPANTDYAAYLAWLEAGNIPEPAPKPLAPKPLTPAEKLSASGLTVDDLKTLLGIS